MDRLERIQHPEIQPLEIGNLSLDGVTLGRAGSYPQFITVFRKCIHALWSGWQTPSPLGCAWHTVSGFTALYLTGGRALNDGVREAMAGLPCAVCYGTDGVYAGVQGGFDILRSRGVTGWMLDLGQSHLKLAAPEHRWVFPREKTHLREIDKVSSMAVPAQRRRFREFIALKLRLALVETRRPPQALVAALPAPLTADGTPLGSSYAGLHGYRELIPDSLELAGLSGVPAFVLNDAELAAFSARLDPRLAEFRKILVLTLGFGIGAALICRSD